MICYLNKSYFTNGEDEARVTVVTGKEAEVTHITQDIS